jgi:acyl dehydratase
MVEAARHIGAATPTFSRRIERATLAAYQRALKLRRPIHSDAAAAKAQGYRDVVAPPGFVIAITVVPRDVKLATFSIDERRALAGGMSFDLHEPVCAGDTLTGRSVLTSIRTKDGKRPLTIMLFETQLVNQLGQLALTVTDSIVEMR